MKRKQSGGAMQSGMTKFSDCGVSREEYEEAVKHRKAFGDIYNKFVCVLRKSRKIEIPTFMKMCEILTIIGSAFNNYLSARKHYHEHHDPYWEKLSEGARKQQRLRRNMDRPYEVFPQIERLLESPNIATFKEGLEWIWSQLDAEEKEREIASGHFIAMTRAINQMRDCAKDESQDATATFVHKMQLYYEGYVEGQKRVQQNKKLEQTFLQSQMPLEITKRVAEFLGSEVEDRNPTLLAQIRCLVSSLVQATGRVSSSKTPSDTSSADAPFDPETSIECILPVEFVSPVKSIPLVEFSPQVERQPTSDSVISCPSDACTAILNMPVRKYLDSVNPPFTFTGEWECYSRQ